MSSANQPLHANFNLDHRIHIQWGRRGSGREDLQKRDYLIQGRAVNCKITQSPYAPWIGIDPVIQIEVCTEDLVCTRYVC